MNQYSEALKALQHEADVAALLGEDYVSLEEYDEDLDEADDSEDEDHGPCAICGDPECSAEQHEDEWDADGNWTGF